MVGMIRVFPCYAFFSSMERRVPMIDKYVDRERSLILPQLSRGLDVACSL